MLAIDFPFKNEILACGAQRQAGFCLTKKNCGYVINDLGNLDQEDVWVNYKQQIEHFTKELKISPKIVAYDLHPEYSSTKYARDLSQMRKAVKYFPCQHHKAHIASCMGENAINHKVIGVVFDGAATGEDSKLWGGEFFVGDLKALRRAAHFQYTPAMDDSSSVARLFDSVCTLIGLREKIDFEGQGVNELGRIVNRSSHVANKMYEFTLKENKDTLLISSESIFENITEDLNKSISKSIISAALHNTIIEIVLQVCRKIAQDEKVKDVILTGQVFQGNKLLFNRLRDLLQEEGFKVISHRHFLSNDSNISFGQAVLVDNLMI
jgi:hydrogenase maturation protein HypF